MITGEEIRRLRKEKKWTQQDLANEVGVAKTTVLDWEKNRYSPEGKNVNNLAAPSTSPSPTSWARPMSPVPRHKKSRAQAAGLKSFPSLTSSTSPYSIPHPLLALGTGTGAWTPFTSKRRNSSRCLGDSSARYRPLPTRSLSASP
ncbi:MAG: XRE family transcriptional regulator [Synergistales bacterium]|nr:XRE family transcriptional regulator [Synergistales bacterium]